MDDIQNMAHALYSDNIDDRRGEGPYGPDGFSWGGLLKDMWANNFIARWNRNGKYAGPRYEYLAHAPMDYNDPMTIALGGHQIPVTSYGTTHPLKRYNPAYNSELKKY